MAQAPDYDVANSTGANVRAELNIILQAILTNNQGTSDPSSPAAGMLFFDTNNSLMKMRNEGNSAFINLFTTSGAPAFPVDGTINSVNIGKGANSVSSNTVLGVSALDAAVTGTNNTAIGHSTLTDLTSGTNCTALGKSALEKNTIGVRNTALGSQALDKNVSGNDNIAIGVDTLGLNTTGELNVAMGDFALDANDSGSSNTAVGHASLGANTTANNNTAFGYNSLAINTTGVNGTAVGVGALDANSTADNNTGIGYNALTDNSTGFNNTALGSLAGDVMTTGSNCTSLGYQADPSSATATNEVTLGNSSITAIRCQVQTISALSDERDKTDIVDSEDGLDIINALRPRKFTWAMREPSDNNGKTELGFVAQEIDAVLGDKNDYIGAVYKTNPDKLEASYGKFVPILVKAVQELTAEVEELKTKLESK